MLNALIVVWRESLEAMLVVGVLLAWVARQSDSARLKRGLWFGVGGGLALAVALGFATFAAQSQLQGETLEAFQVGMMLFAAILIVLMVLWMRRHGRRMKQHLEHGATRAAQGWGQFGLATIAALAVAREGAETVVFLYGLGMEQQGRALAVFFAYAGAGVAAAAMTAWVVARGARFLNYRVLFRVSEVLLLLIACSLLGNSVDALTRLDWLPPLIDPAWDFSALLDDSRGFGRLLADFAGYRARPTASLLIAYAAFWLFTYWRLSRATS